jgi:glucosamine--fructose-6-phosphate aminotransferase (isomerizing)
LVNLIEEIQKKQGEQTWKSSTNCGAPYNCCFDKNKRIGGCTISSPLRLVLVKDFLQQLRCIAFIEYTSNAVYLEDGEMAIFACISQ